MKPAFNNQVCLITGAGSGIGRALALEMARHGAVIAALDLHAGPLMKLAAELPASAWRVADVTDRAAVARATADFVRELGPVEILIASAGIGFTTSAMDYDAASLEQIVRVNLFGVSNAIAAVLPGMLQRGRGRLAAISSIASYRGMPLMAGYCASKAGVNALMESLRVELEPLGIFCTTVCPGWVRTPLAERSAEEARQRFGASLVPRNADMVEAPAAARMIVQAIRRRRSFLAFPLWMHWRGALLRWLPGRGGDRLFRWILRMNRSGKAAAAGLLEANQTATLR
jgi:NAD(P)-dependent dehydrogenase (short-subunit alcohol dehydrogenase family)